VRFPLLKSIYLEDCWPLEGYGAVLEFERVSKEVKAIIVTFSGEPVVSAPTIAQITDGKVVAEIRVRDNAEPRAQTIVKRFSDYTNLHYTLQIDFDDVTTEYLAENDSEREAIKLHKHNRSRKDRKRAFPFSMIAQAFFAGEGPDDPSFAGHLTRAAREALIAEQYIDAFRYSFLLIEALYGDGKFKKHDLVHALDANHEFKGILVQTLSEISSTRDASVTAAMRLIQDLGTPEKVIEHLVDRRGFYFHGNIKRKDAWHPDHQSKAKAIAELGVSQAMAIAHTFSEPMYAPEISQKYFKNAQKQGVIMTITVRFKLRDENGFVREGATNINTPGTIVTNALATGVHKNFLEWAEGALIGSQLLSAVGVDKATGKQVFTASYSDVDASGEGEQSDQSAQLV
jgi:hypothetical protein